ncbi:MAG: serine hydrolase domain-containing protein [Bacteroidota bacterium]
MRKATAFSLFILFNLVAYTAFSQTLESKIDLLYQVPEGAPGFSIAVFKGNQILMEEQYGTAHLDHDVPVTAKTVFDIGSIAKQFTAASILLLEAEGKLSLEDPVYQYIEDLPRYKKGDPTIEHLLNQTSGIKEVDDFLEVVDVFWRDYINHSMLLNIITKVDELRFTPGEYFNYTNANYILLASIIEEVSGMSYESYLHKAIFEPLSMQNTLVNTDAYRTIKNRAIGYIEDEQEYYKSHYYGLLYKGDGQIITNPRDMFQWHLGIKNATIGSPELWKRMQTKAKLNNGTEINYGLGVEFETHNGYEAHGFDGMITSGFVSKYLYFPKLDIAFFTTQNTFDWDFKERFFQLVDLYVPESENEQPTVAETTPEVSATDLKRYEGTYLFYRSDEERKANTIQLKDGALRAYTLDGYEIAKLIPAGDHRFYFGEDKDAILEFNLEGKTKEYTYDDFENEAPWVFHEYEPHEHSPEELKEFEGDYFNNDFQISKKLVMKDDVLYYYYRNGASKQRMGSLSKNLLEISISPIQFIRNRQGQITGFDIMGLVFEKIQTKKDAPK